VGGHKREKRGKGEGGRGVSRNMLGLKKQLKTPSSRGSLRSGDSGIKGRASSTANMFLHSFSFASKINPHLRTTEPATARTLSFKGRLAQTHIAMNQVTKFDGTHEDLIHDVSFNYYGNRLGRRLQPAEVNAEVVKSNCSGSVILYSNADSSSSFSLML